MRNLQIIARLAAFLLPLALAACAGVQEDPSQQQVTEETGPSGAAPILCKSSAECPHSNVCALCTPGRGPACATAECVDGHCVAVGPCSSNVACSSAVADACPHSNICALCSPGRGPACASASCVEGYCVDIEPCSQQW